MNNPSRHDLAFLRGMTGRRLGRRDALRLTGLSAAGLVLAACGVQGKSVSQPTSSAQVESEVDKYWSGKTQNGHVDFANWPLYMDPKLPELKEFTKRTGITVDYKEVIQETTTWYAKIQPQLAAGQSIGYDVMIVTNSYQLTQLIKLGYLAPLDHSRLPNFAKNADEQYKRGSFDPGNVYTVPYASGMTGIAYNPKYIDTPPTSYAALWDPKYKGKVGMMADSQEIANFAMFLLGIDPATSTEADWEKAAEKLREQRDSGIVRKYYDQSYIDPLAKGDIWITQAWSGDIFQKNLSDGTDLKFVIPDEGATLWTDNFMIPITAANPVDAITMIDFFYEVDIAASMAEYINYIPPVSAARDVILAKAEKASGAEKKELETIANSPLVFPSQEDYAKLRNYVTLDTGEKHRKFESIFQPITTS